MSFKSDLYRAPDSSLWKGRVDSETDQSQFRYHQVVETTDLRSSIPSNEKVLLGFPCDIGVKRNGGRTGAAEGPDYFSSSIGSLSWHGDDDFCDTGNITPKNNNLESAQQELGKTIHLLLKKGNIPTVIGGGHETAFGHFLGIAGFLQETEPDCKIGILNIDAHFDLRPYNGVAHSGSPFLQAHEHAKENDLDLKYFVYGINRDNNTSSLFKTAEDLDVRYCENIQVMNSESECLKNVSRFIHSRTHIYLTICLDVFKASVAPGVSAPAWNGIDLIHGLNIIELVKQSGKLISADICELNPSFDEHKKTAKLAGSLFSKLIG
ncbi:MAG: formimidoylglutamase [Balneolaceae bacterium]|nr:formimidoylglutamase [Balneolaceae bacterium]MBO6545363.1 formimidoylglutamase [Balneolaceae bacterium]MBO6646759.1 formimidoylglutamase [Balneolaceae bacterium]